MASKIKFELKLEIINSKARKLIDNIYFSNICFVKIFLDGNDILENELFQGSFIYFKELKKSTIETGDYLLFTAVSGIADDAGWDYVNVFHNGNSVIWQFEREDCQLMYEFDKDKYISEINKLEREIGEVSEDIALEPKNVIYPE